MTQGEERLRGRRRRRLGRAAFFGALVVAACAAMLAARKPRRATALSRTPAGGAAQADPEAEEADEAGTLAGRVTRLVEDARLYRGRVWSFSLEDYELTIEDAGMTTALDEVLARSGADFVVNAGFFDPEGRPVGLAVSKGVVLSRLAKALSGGVLAAGGSRAELFPSEGFVLPDGGSFALQCRPRLVVGGAANVKRDDGRRAERTALCLRDGGRTVDVVVVHGSDDGESPGPSLFGLARHLAEVGCESALNLDGGPSTGAAWRDGDRTTLLAPRGPVRHVVAFRRR